MASAKIPLVAEQLLRARFSEMKALAWKSVLAA